MFAEYRGPKTRLPDGTLVPALPAYEPIPFGQLKVKSQLAVLRVKESFVDSTAVHSKSDFEAICSALGIRDNPDSKKNLTAYGINDVIGSALDNSVSTTSIALAFNDLNINELLLSVARSRIRRRDLAQDFIAAREAALVSQHALVRDAVMKIDDKRLEIFQTYIKPGWEYVI